MTTNKNQIDMINGSLLDKIILFGMPLAASSILQQLFNTADTMVVGRFAGSEALAAVGSNSPLINLIINLFIGISVGANVVIANYIGQGRTKNIGKIVRTVYVVAILTGFAVLAIGQVVSRPALNFLQVPDDVIELSTLYLRIYFYGIPCFMVYNFSAAILRSIGDTKRPLMILTFSGVVNVLLNLLFVIRFSMGVMGVALATAISNAVSAVLVTVVLLRENSFIRLTFKEEGWAFGELNRIAAIGMPAGLQGILFCIANIVIQSATNSLGSDVMAGASAGYNLEVMVYYFAAAFNQTCTTFTSQNFGAKKLDRCSKVYLYCMGCGVVSMLAIGWTEYIFRYQLLGIFSTSEAVIEAGIVRLTSCVILEWMLCSYEIAAGAMRGRGHSLLPSMLMVLGTVGFRLTWVATVFASYHTYRSLMIVYPASWVFTGAIVNIAYFTVARKQNRTIGDGCFGTK